MNQIKNLFLHEVRLELKNKNSLTSLIVYAVSSIYITYLCYRQTIDVTTWNALYWIIMLFAATNAVAKSFLSESKGLQLYYYTLLSPRKVILAKTAYNTLLLICVGVINYICYSVLFETIISDRIQFFVGLILGSIGLSATLTLVSGIASRANNSSALIAILGFPLLLPLLLVILQFSKNAIDGLDWSLNQSNFILLTSLDGIIIILSYLLFPYLWRD